MKIRPFILGAITISVMSGALISFAAERTGMVKVHRLNVRVRPGQYTVVGTLARGDKVRILEEQNGWYRIALSSDAAVWVHGDFVKDGKIVSRVNLRSGPGINYNSFGVANAGQPVTVIDDKNKDWIKIAPLPDMSAWVAAEFIAVDDVSTVKPPVAGTETVPAVPTDKTEDKQVEQQVSPDTLPFINENPEAVSKDGFVLKASGSAGLTHALCRYEFGSYTPVCYLYGDTEALDKAVEKQVKIKGLLRWVKGWRLPVVKVEELTITP
ncbi:MAG: SH3 domain-containing protein [Victivallales bacterium]|nr:SH3 domain-containing protein [Victivallales bacterium]